MKDRLSNSNSKAMLKTPYAFAFLLALFAIAVSCFAQTTSSASSTEPNAWPSQQPPAPENINQTFGIPLFGTTSLWNEEVVAVDKRLKLRKESLSDDESSFQAFNKNADTKILGCRYFLSSTQGLAGKLVGITILFANKSDASAFATDLERQMRKTYSHLPRVSMQDQAAMEAAMRDDYSLIRQKLNAILGDGKTATLITSSGRETGTLWDWRGHSFFLVMVPREYVSLKILPSSSFGDADVGRTRFAKITQALPNKVRRLPNGDVLIDDIPMIDEGADATMSAPTSASRLLRYYGLQADPVALSSAAGSANKKNSASLIGPSLSTVLPTLNSQLTAVGARVVFVQGATIPVIKPYIDRGQPVLWTVYGPGQFKSLLKKRSADRAAVTDWNDWVSNGLGPARAKAQSLPSRGQAHTCLIIGYNENTRELAVSNPWGPAYNIGWITQEEAHYINQGSGGTIAW